MAGKLVADAIQRDQDNRLARSALEKRAAGIDPNRREIAALRRVEKAKIVAAIELVAEGIPKKYWVQWSGRQHKILLDQADAHNAPFADETISIKEVARWLHEFLAKNKHKLIASKDDADESDMMMTGIASPALEDYRRAKAKLAWLEYEAKVHNLLKRSHVHAGLGRLAQMLRELHSNLMRKHGTDVADKLKDVIEDFQADVDDLFKPPEESSNDRK